jgi:hypothetical protein
MFRGSVLEVEGVRAERAKRLIVKIVSKYSESGISYIGVSGSKSKACERSQLKLLLRNLSKRVFWSRIFRISINRDRNRGRASEASKATYCNRRKRVFWNRVFRISINRGRNRGRASGGDRY